jgi:superfamily I DNA/RNA helicase
MKNRYPGTCQCGTFVAANAGETFKIDGKWMVNCIGCIETSAHAPAETVACQTAPGPVSWERRASGRAGDATPGQHREQTSNVAPGSGNSPARTEYTLLSGHPASAYQAAIFDDFRYGKGSVIVMAGAGSGKTTSMKNMLRFVRSGAHVKVLAFGHDAAGQLKDAIAELTDLAQRGDDPHTAGKDFSNVRACSFHSEGYGAVRRYLGKDIAVKIDDNKCRRLLKAHLIPATDTGAGKALYDVYAPFVVKLVAFAKGEGVGTYLAPDTDERWYDLIEHHGLYLDTTDADETTGVALARQLLGWSNAEAKAGIIDFNDQIYLVCLWKLRLWRNDVVVVDEGQDTNPTRRAMLHLMLKDGGRLYAVGDETQSIMGFTGASVDAMQRIKTEFNCRELPLTVSYRCARAIVARAQTWMPRLEPAPGAVDGRVIDDLPLHAALALLTPQDAILCRQTAPLVTVAYGLIARGRACRVLGKEIGEGLVNLIEQQKAKGIDRLMEKLTRWSERETAKFIAKGEETKAEAVADRVACVVAIVNALAPDERTIPGLIRKIEGMFVDPVKGQAPMLTLATQHKSKGKEWKRVAILCPELNPSKAARQEWQMTQEYNLMGVAATRAMEELIYCAEADTAIEAPRTRET